MRARVQGKNPYIHALFLFVYGFGIANSAFIRTNEMLALSGVFKFSDKCITHFGRGAVFYLMLSAYAP